MCSQPNITVIITAHDRKDFIRYAVDSVLAQDLSKDKFEIIVVKNYFDREIDEYFNKLNIRNIIMNSSPIGEKLALAIHGSRGNIICFLEDDDTFVNFKLRRILEIFSQQDVCFCFNSYQTIDVHGNFIPSNIKQRLIKSYQISSADYKKKPKKLKPIAQIIRNSSISIRKNILEQHLTELERIRISPDFFMFYVALLSSSTLYIEAEKMTNYRVHHSASNFISSQNEFLFAKITFLNNSMSDAIVIKEMLTNSIYEKYLDVHMHEIEATLKLCSNETIPLRKDSIKSLLAGYSLHNSVNRYLLLFTAILSRYRKEPIIKLYYLFWMHQNRRVER